METKYDVLKLDHQLCFPLYVVSKEIVRLYKPLLDPLGLTYTQYIAMMALWEKDHITVKELGERLFLDSGTLTPLLKKMAAQGWIERNRSLENERNVIIHLTPAGWKLRDDVLHVPHEIGKCVNLSTEDAQALYRILNQLILDQ